MDPPRRERPVNLVEKLVDLGARAGDHEVTPVQTDLECVCVRHGWTSTQVFSLRQIPIRIIPLPWRPADGRWLPLTASRRTILA